jgi:dual specificity phosphatase 12
MADKGQTEIIIVVGLNRARLTKILALVHESEEKDDVETSISLRPFSENGHFEKFTIDYLPCIASMSSYEADDGEQIRFMANFVYHDGAPMTKYFDDESFRSALTTVLMVGYEWHPSDRQRIEGYFKANNLSVSVLSVSPNPGFTSLHDEMEAFKVLSEDEKAKHLSDRTMGPGKMARFVLESACSIKEKLLGISTTDNELECPELGISSEPVLLEQVTSTSVSHEREHQTEPPDPDPELPMFACRICRTILFGQNNLAQDHKQNLHSFKRHHTNAQGLQQVPCQSLFCNESVLGWLSPHGADVEGKLECPKCSVKLGHWNWVGAQCSCGTWVVPAIQIPISKVDTIHPATALTTIMPMVLPTTTTS